MKNQQSITNPDLLPEQWIGKQAYSVTITDSKSIDEKEQLTLVPFADASQTGGAIKVWMPLNVTGTVKRKKLMKKIVVIGSANTDMVVKSAKLPLPGETLLGGTFFMNAGGKGANQAVAAARAGGNVTLIAKVGNDIFGKQTIEGLQKENINTDYVFVDDTAPSGTALIMVNDEGENCIVVAPGANANLLPADIEKVKNISDAEIILMQLEIPMETIIAVAKIAKSNNQKVIINPAPAQKLDDELLNGLFLITPNETEASLLTGIKVVDEETASQAADSLFKQRSAKCDHHLREARRLFSK